MGKVQKSQDTEHDASPRSKRGLGWNQDPADSVKLNLGTASAACSPLSAEEASLPQAEHFRHSRDRNSCRALLKSHWNKAGIHVCVAPALAGAGSSTGALGMGQSPV